MRPPGKGKRERAPIAAGDSGEDLLVPLRGGLYRPRNPKSKLLYRRQSGCAVVGKRLRGGPDG